MTGIKLYHFLLETVVMIFITLGFATATPGSLLIGLLYCDFIITLVQIIHSFILASVYGNNARIYRRLRYYWKGVSICIFLFLILMAVINFNGNERDSAMRTFFTWLVSLLPLVPSIYLWIITWHFRSWGKQVHGTFK